MFSPYRDFSPEEAARFQGEIDEVYRVFLGRVSEGREMSVADVDSVAQGRVWTGLAARNRGLVDELGGIYKAIAMARAKADIAPDEAVIVETFPHYERTFLSSLFGELIGEHEDDDEMVSRIDLPPVLRAWMVAAKFPAGAIFAMMPWSIEIR
jgi:ClpP class serine protease